MPSDAAPTLPQPLVQLLADSAHFCPAPVGARFHAAEKGPWSKMAQAGQQQAPLTPVTIGPFIKGFAGVQRTSWIMLVGQQSRAG